MLNSAGRDGGGLAIEGGSGGGTKFYATDPGKPVYLSGNSAGREGGGIKVNSYADAIGWDLIVSGNRSYDEGGGISLFQGEEGSSRFTMTDSLAEAPAAAIHCASQWRCNRISENIAENDDSEPQRAAALRVRANGGFDAFAFATAELRGTYVENNSGSNIVLNSVPCDEADQSHGTIIINGASIGSNVAGADLINNVNNYSTLGFCSAFVDIQSTTIGGNTISGTNVIRTRADFGLGRSIVWQPGKRVLEITASSLEDGDVHHVLASDLIGIPPSVTNFIADPRFMDEERGDLHLQASSPAIDFAPAAGGDAEADNRPRVVNLALVPDADGFGPQDVGAYERQTIGNLVRNAAFDDDVHLWTAVPPATVSWSPSDHLGSATSGSVEIVDETDAMHVVGLRQCVGIPGPGAYRLDGYAWVSDNGRGNIDDAVIAWTYHPDSADCTGGSAGAGEQSVLGLGWNAVPAQYIVVDDQDWNPNTSVEIELIVDKRVPFPPDDHYGLARFDDVALIYDASPETDLIFADGFDG